MSNEFNALRSRARERRDKAIAEARREYSAQLVKIAELESYQTAAARRGIATAAWMREWLNKAAKRESKRD
jgi:hypothetical protein